MTLGGSLNPPMNFVPDALVDTAGGIVGWPPNPACCGVYRAGSTYSDPERGIGGGTGRALIEGARAGTYGAVGATVAG